MVADSWIESPGGSSASIAVRMPPRLGVWLPTGATAASIPTSVTSPSPHRSIAYFLMVSPHTGAARALSRCYSCPHQRDPAVDQSSKGSLHRDRTEPRRTRHQHHPLSLGRRCAEGELRPSRLAHGRGRAGLRAVDTVHAPRSGGSVLARP